MEGLGFGICKFDNEAAEQPGEHLRWSGRKGDQRGGKGAAGGPCYYCGKPGHIAKDRKKKKKTADIEAGIITPQQPKRKAAARMRAKFVVKAEGDDA